MRSSRTDNTRYEHGLGMSGQRDDVPCFNLLLNGEMSGQMAPVKT